MLEGTVESKGIDMRLRARAQKRRQPGEMTKTESRYAEVLEAMRLKGEIQEWAFEPERLVLAKATQYTPDFRVILSDGAVVFVEVKPHGWRKIANQDKGAVKIKVAAELHPYLFWRATELRQRDGGGFEVETIERK